VSVETLRAWLDYVNEATAIGLGIVLPGERRP
jgi:hypothetical protein